VEVVSEEFLSLERSGGVKARVRAERSKVRSRGWMKILLAIVETLGMCR